VLRVPTPTQTLHHAVTKLKARKAARRRREIALLAIASAFVVAALVLREPFLILVSIFPALASFGQR
jgi:hypothetical protein